MYEITSRFAASVVEKSAPTFALSERGTVGIAQATRTPALEVKRAAVAMSASPMVYFYALRRRADASLRAITSGLAMLMCGVLSAGNASGQATPSPNLIYAMELGVGAGHATIEPPGSNSEFSKFTVTQPGDWTASGLLGRTERFGDTSVDVGGSFTKTLPRDIEATVALSSGTGEFISPRYRVDTSLRAPILLSDRSLIASGGFRRIQSKGENSSNGINAGLGWYVGGNWLFGAGIEADRGYPGDTISKLYSASATLYEYKRWYVGTTYRQGHVAYTNIGPTLTLVDYPTRSLGIGGSWWWSKRDALSVNADYADNSFYTARYVSVRWYREFP